MLTVPTGAEDVRVLGVWGLTPLGECLCPRGYALREDPRCGRIVTPGECPRPGKHPWWVKSPDGGTFGFRNGLHDAVTVDEWNARYGELVGLLDGRPAYALPSDIWVLDVDGDHAWKGLVKLIASGRVPFDRVLAVAHTPRGWHVWYRAAGPGWTTGTAQRELNAALDEVGALRGLEAKSGGGYVVAPDGVERTWVGREAFADRVAWSVGLLTGWGSAWQPVPGPALAAGDAPVPLPQAAPPTVPDPDDVNQFVARMARVELNKWCAYLANHCAEGRRNNQLFLTAVREGRRAVASGVPVERVKRVLHDAGLRAGLEPREVAATVRSGLGL